MEGDPALVQAVEELGAEASGRCADLAIVEIPDGVAWQIEEYHGYEHVAEKHRTWRASPNWLSNLGAKHHETF